MDLGAYLDAARAFDQAFRGRWEPVAAAPAAEVDPGRLAAAWEEYTGRLQDNYPFFHPRYAGQMLKPPHPVAMAGYLAAMTVNPNNHALDGGPATGAMEKEVVGDLAAMFGLPGDTLGHLTSSGTIANLEALWVARQLAPGKAVAHSQDAHYTHARMCEVLGVESVAVPADAAGRMDLDALEPLLASGRVGTVVLTAGTTGLGAVDPVAEALSCGTAIAPAADAPTAASCPAGRRQDGAKLSGWRRRPAAGVGGVRLGGGRPPQARPPALRLRGGAVPRPGGRPAVPPRLALHLLHLRRAPPGRDQPGVLAGRGGRRRPLADPAGPAP
jgi:hypothetical protein